MSTTLGSCQPFVTEAGNLDSTSSHIAFQPSNVHEDPGPRVAMGSGVAVESQALILVDSGVSVGSGAAVELQAKQICSTGTVSRGLRGVWSVELLGCGRRLTCGMSRSVVASQNLT